MDLCDFQKLRTVSFISVVISGQFFCKLTVAGHRYHLHVPGPLQTPAIKGFHSSLSSVLLISSLLGGGGGGGVGCFFTTQLFRLSSYFFLSRCLPLLLLPQIFPPNICISNPSALFFFHTRLFPILLRFTSFQSY